MKKKARIKHSFILEGAKKHLWDGSDYITVQDNNCIHICFAIESFAGNCLYKHMNDGEFIERGGCRAAQELKDWIQEMLGEEYDSFSEWFYGKNPGIIISDEQMQALRLQWMNEMIAYLKSVGK